MTRQLLNSLWITSVVCLVAVQPVRADVLQVTGVRLNPTASGLEVILESDGAPAQVFTSSDGNTFVADIINAQLKLPGGNTFRQDNPTEGITSVTVTPLDANRIRIRVRGTAEVPTGQVVQNNQMLVFRLMAPSTQPQSTEPLGERLIVGVTRREEEQSDVPRSVTEIPRKRIEQQFNITPNLADILGKEVPGFSPPAQSSSTFGQTLRGRNSLVLIDGVPQSTSRNVFRDLETIDPSAIEQIEVLRGPTAIYGDGATGGVINITTIKPTEGKPITRTDVGLGTSLTHFDDSVEYNLRQFISRKEGAADFVFSASLVKTSGFFDAQGDRIPPDPNGQGGLADSRTFSILGKVGVDLDEDQRLQLTINHFNQEQDTDFTTDPIVDTLPSRQKARALRGLELDNPQGTQNTVVNLQYNNENLLGSRVRGQVYYRNFQTRFFPFDGRNFASLGNLIFQSQLESERWGSRLQIDTPLSRGDVVNLLWGIDYSYEDSSQPVTGFDQNIYANSRGLVFRQTGKRSWTPPFQQKNLGLFAQLKWELSERLILNGGVRQEIIGVNADDFTTIRGDSIGGGNLDYDATLFNIGTVFKITEEVNIYANFAQGFSVADIGLALRDARRGFSVSSLRPEAQKVNNYEIGVRGNWNSIQASFAGFYNQSDLGITFTAPGTVSRSPQRIYGVEAALDVKPVKNWQLGTTVSWVEGERDSNNNGSYDASLDGFIISPLKLTAYVENQTLPGWQNRLQLLYSGSRNPQGSGFGLGSVKSYFTLDYISSIKVGPGTLQIGVENLLNKHYFPVVSQLQTNDSNSG